MNMKIKGLLCLITGHQYTKTIDGMLWFTGHCLRCSKHKLISNERPVPKERALDLIESIECLLEKRETSLLDADLCKLNEIKSILSHQPFLSFNSYKFLCQYYKKVLTL